MQLVIISQKLYRILGVDKDCQDEALRSAFVDLVKRYHPIQFSKIEAAYREIKRLRDEKKESPTPNVEEFDIEHKAPRHRHYLTYDTGIGNLKQRMHAAERAREAAVNAMEQFEKLTSGRIKDKQPAKDIKVRYGMDRLVEDLIQESMNKGEFKNLRGMGKPLPDKTNSFNPYVDFVTHKMNEILIDNGFIPEWIQLSKEIRQDIKRLKSSSDNLENRIKEINEKIDKYNLVVPILQKQMTFDRTDPDEKLQDS